MNIRFGVVLIALSILSPSSQQTVSADKQVNTTIQVNTTNTTVVNNCVNSTWLSKFGLTVRSSPLVVKDSLCKGLYDVGGSCADVDAVKKYLNSLNAKYRQRAIDAQDSASLLSLQEVYLGAINRNQTLLNTPIKTGLGGVFDSVVNTLKTVFKSAKEFFADLWKNASGWVLRIFNKTSGSINPCFQAWNQIANGVFCALTSSNELPKEVHFEGVNTYYRFQANATIVGPELNKCITLIDNYCLLTYGVSVSDSSTFNATFNWADNGMSRQDCVNLQQNYNCSNSNCKESSYNILVRIFNSEDMPFIREAEDIQALYKFLRQNTVQQPSVYVPIKKNTQVGLTLSSNTAGSDFVSIGSKAGLEIGVFNSDSTKLSVSNSIQLFTQLTLLFSMMSLLFMR